MHSIPYSAAKARRNGPARFVRFRLCCLMCLAAWAAFLLLGLPFWLEHGAIEAESTQLQFVSWILRLTFLAFIVGTVIWLIWQRRWWLCLISPATTLCYVAFPTPSALLLPSEPLRSVMRDLLGI